MDKIARLLLIRQMIQNPLPWRIVRDWTYEVISLNEAVIAKCQDYSEATEIIRLAHQIQRELKSAEEDLTSTTDV